MDARLIPLFLSLGLDTLALSIMVGVAPLSSAARLRLALTFALAEGVMPAVGLVVGQPLGHALGGWSAYAAAALVIGAGLWILREALADDDDDDGEGARVARAASAGGLALLGIALSVSLDELAVGFSFGLLRLPVAPALLAIGLQAFCLSVCGLWLGQQVGVAAGERAEALAGALLCLLGVGLVVARLTGVVQA